MVSTQSASFAHQHQSFVAALIHTRPFDLRLVTSTRMLEHQIHALSVSTSTSSASASSGRCECAACGWNACPLRSPPLALPSPLNQPKSPDSDSQPPSSLQQHSVRSSIKKVQSPSTAAASQAPRDVHPVVHRVQRSIRSRGDAREPLPLAQSPAVVRSSVSFVLSPAASRPRHQRLADISQKPSNSSSPVPHSTNSTAVAALPLCAPHAMRPAPPAAPLSASTSSSPAPAPAPLSSPLHVDLRGPISMCPSVGPISISSTPSSAHSSRTHSHSHSRCGERSSCTSSSSTLCSICDAHSPHSQVLLRLDSLPAQFGFVM